MFDDEKGKKVLVRKKSPHRQTNKQKKKFHTHHNAHVDEHAKEGEHAAEEVPGGHLGDAKVAYDDDANG